MQCLVHSCFCSAYPLLWGLTALHPPCTHVPARLLAQGFPGHEGQSSSSFLESVLRMLVGISSLGWSVGSCAKLWFVRSPSKTLSCPSGSSWRSSSSSQPQRSLTLISRLPRGFFVDIQLPSYRFPNLMSKAIKSMTFRGTGLVTTAYVDMYVALAVARFGVSDT